jgi:hypothetical protein
VPGDGTDTTVAGDPTAPADTTADSAPEG